MRVCHKAESFIVEDVAKVSICDSSPSKIEGVRGEYDNCNIIKSFDYQ